MDQTQWNEAIEIVARNNDRIVLQVDGHDKAALISLDDLKLLEQLEERFERDDARDETSESDAPVITDAIRKELGLT